MATKEENTKRMREWRKQHPEHNSNTRWKRIGLVNEDGAPFTTIDRDRAYQQQMGRCANSACNKHESELKTILQADHCHITGRFRGLLCGSCNRALGDVQDNIKLLDGLKKYLRSK